MSTHTAPSPTSPRRRPPPHPSPPPKIPHLPASSAITKVRNTNADTHGDVKRKQSINDSPYRNGDSSPHRPVTSTTNSPFAGAAGETRPLSSPLSSAASLIQTLDMAHSEMTNFAADAARDAETARRNARKAQEIARRYQNRSYPKTRTSFGDPMNGDNNGDYGSMTTDFEASSPSVSSAMIMAKSTLTPTRPNPPKLRSFDGTSIEGHSDYDSSGENERLNTMTAQLQTPPAAATTQLAGRGRALDPTSSTETSEEITLNKMQQTQPLADQISKLCHLDGKTPCRAMHTPSSVADRIAQHHAEDILQLTQELEQTRRALKEKERMHKECELSLSSLEAKNKCLEEQNHKLMLDLEEERQRASQQVSDLEQELEQERRRVQEANEDAEIAVDIAKASSEERNEMEDELTKALEELRMWKEWKTQLGVSNGNGNGNILNRGVGENLALATTLQRHVHFADESLPAGQRHHHNHVKGEVETPESESPSETHRPTRSIVAAGRQVLRRNMASSPEDTVVMLELTPSKSAELRERFRQRLTELGDGVCSPPRPYPGSPARTGGEANVPSINSAARKKLDECYAATKILQTSGKKLDLDGYWWRDHHLQISSSKASRLSNLEVQLDAMTRQYCQNVEFKIDRQQKEIKELESLCGFLEKKLVLDEDF